MAARILAQLLVSGGTMVFRAATQAYRQALINGQKAGITPETAKAAVRSSKMAIDEARMILGVDAAATREEITKKFEHLMKVNEENGSFYLQSKVFRAKERLEMEFPADDGPNQQQQQQQKGS